MNIDEWIYARLNSQVAAVSGRVSMEIGDQQSAKPYLVVKLITDEPFATHDVQLPATRNWHYDICAVAATDASARAVAVAAEAALVGYQGSGIQSVLRNGGMRKVIDLTTGDYEWQFGISIWENLT